MKPKPKRIKHLYHQFIAGTDFERLIEPQDLAVAMHLEGMIDLIGHRSEPWIEHYRETAEFAEWENSLKSEIVYRLMERMNLKIKGSL